MEASDLGHFTTFSLSFYFVGSVLYANDTKDEYQLYDYLCAICSFQYELADAAMQSN